MRLGGDSLDTGQQVRNPRREEARVLTKQDGTEKEELAFLREKGAVLLGCQRRPTGGLSRPPLGLMN